MSRTELLTADEVISADVSSDDLRPLVRQCLSGCQGSMLELVRRFQGRVYGLCLRMLGRREDAEDAAQETLVRMLRSLSHWDERRAFEPWLLAIAGNRCRTSLALRRRRLATETLDDEKTPSKLLDDSASQLTEEVQLALLQLRAEYREAFILFHEHEKSYQEISEALRIPLGTVKTWVHRARRELVDRLKQRGVVEESSRELR